MHRKVTNLQSFDCEAEEIAPDNPATARPADRPRSLDLSAPGSSPSVQFFDCQAVELSEGTAAAPRPNGKERQLPVAGPNNREPSIEQKVVSTLIAGFTESAQAEPPVEHFSEYLSKGWKVKQLTTIPGGESGGWIVVWLEREMLQQERRKRKAGSAKGKIQMSEDFDDFPI